MQWAAPISLATTFNLKSGGQRVLVCRKCYYHPMMGNTRMQNASMAITHLNRHAEDGHRFDPNAIYLLRSISWAADIIAEIQYFYIEGT